MGGVDEQNRKHRTRRNGLTAQQTAAPTDKLWTQPGASTPSAARTLQGVSRGGDSLLARRRSVFLRAAEHRVFYVGEWVHNIVDGAEGIAPILGRGRASVK